MQPYVVENNQWGAASGTGTQCVSTSGGHTKLAWGVNWDWSGGSGEVKAFPSAVLGWQWGWPVPGTGLPIRVSDHRPVRTNWTYSLKLGQSAQGDRPSYDVSYLLWFHTKSNPTWADNPAAAVRVVLEQDSPVATQGRSSTLEIDGERWAVFNSVNGWTVTTFVRLPSRSALPPRRSFSLNLTDFVDAAAGLKGLGSRTYLTSVQAGANVLTGSGSLQTTAYNVAIGR